MTTLFGRFTPTPNLDMTRTTSSIHYFFSHGPRDYCLSRNPLFLTFYHQ
ncbi:hypothetical protein Golob_022998 [Gossypium lobatum]|uniref:Uncharacterized protein n=1 Tax=Gossypium lobatum TaxID=34289 RepID=A0A7J8LI98_9ROSI|nr:hypothetical protein [Gossypium lobatum]